MGPTGKLKKLSDQAMRRVPPQNGSSFPGWAGRPVQGRATSGTGLVRFTLFTDAICLSWR